MAGADSDGYRDTEGDDDGHPQAAWPSIEIFPIRHTKVFADTVLLSPSPALMVFPL